MPEQSHLDEMNAAIRAQRERQAVPRSMVSTEDARPAPDASAREQTEPAPAAEPEPKRGLLARLRGRS
ncbi:MAG TPA: hypothetical protein VJ986_04205 [Gaiellaceae bacterium]|nr:hypothetical protein [Gaiellaceae bacterium]